MIEHQRNLENLVLAKFAETKLFPVLSQKLILNSKKLPIF